MSRDPRRGHAALRRGRFSQAGATYFLTVCTERRKTGLTSVDVAQMLVDECTAMNRDASWQLRGATIMPDHLHLLIVLGERLALGRTISRLKSKTSAKLRDAGIEWERHFFDHKLRADEPLLPLLLYLYLNPYRSGLITAGQRWPHFFCAPDDWNWFKDHLQDDLPPPEWLR